MASLDKLYELHHLLHGARVPVPMSRMMEALECSNSTVNRIIKGLRKQFGAPIQYQRDHPPGYLYTNAKFQIPGAWFTPETALSLVTLEQLLRQFEPGLMDPILEPVRKALSETLEAQGLTADIGNRIRLLRVAARPTGPCFSLVANALLRRRRLELTYFARSTGETGRRQVSPQRLVHYDGYWVLDVWCHKQSALRSLSVDCISDAVLLNTDADFIPNEVLDRVFTGSYGIFSGEPTALARLKFTPFRARWVSVEQWHPQQNGRFLDTGEYVLEIPYHRSEELIMRIMALRSYRLNVLLVARNGHSLL
jgi:predicted DNA-binding transcriptional regulator YafY